MRVFIVKNLRPQLNLLISRQYTTELYPYTTELYKKNYIKYTVQSKSGIFHDYVYHGDERLPTLEERLKEFNEDADVKKNQIGKLRKMPKLKEFKKEMEAKIEENKSSKTLEIESREQKINVPIDIVNKQTKILTAFSQIREIAEHYNIYKDLLGNEYFFKPVMDLSVKYSTDDGSFKNVFYGNKIKAQDTKKAPIVSWEDTLKSLNKDEEVYHSLLFVNLDGNFNNNQNDILLWFIGNVKNGDLKTGNELVEYLQPFPMRGTGWHRCVYVLFEHSKSIDFDIKKETSNKFEKRNFKSSSFYEKYKENLVPVGLSFFQTEWDLSVKNTFHNYFDMKDPVYEFKFESKFIPKFEKYPKNKQPFNWYFQDYMDKKDVYEQVMKDYLKQLSPFEYYPEPAKYPLIERARGPRWYKYELDNYRKRKHQYKIIPFKYFSPITKIDEQIKNLPYQQN